MYKRQAFTLNMIKFLTPFEKISKLNKTLILIGWLVLLIIIWFATTSGEKHLFPSPSQVLNGFQELYNEGLVVHIFNSLSLCFISIFLATIISLILAYSWPIPVLKSISEFVTKFRFLPFTGLSFYITCLLYTSPSPRDATLSRMPSSA